MIPLPIPSIFFVIMMLLGPIVLIVLTLWLLAVIFSAGARSAFRRHIKKSVALVLFMILCATPFLALWLSHYSFKLALKEKEKLRHFTLAQPKTLDGIPMPVGTRLYAINPNIAESFEDAIFPSVAIVQGVPALEINRKLSNNYGENGPFISMSNTIKPAFDILINGWSCSAADSVKFSRSAENEPMKFSSCRLSSGQEKDGITFPKGWLVTSSDGTKYTDGQVDSDRWHVCASSEESNEPIIVRGMRLENGCIYFGVDLHLMMIKSRLSKQFSLGEITYPAGTRVKMTPIFLRKKYPEAFVFSYIEKNLPYPGHADIPKDQSVVQLPTGEVLAILPKEETGFLDFEFAEIIVRPNSSH